MRGPTRPRAALRLVSRRNAVISLAGTEKAACVQPLLKVARIVENLPAKLHKRNGIDAADALVFKRAHREPEASGGLRCG